MSKFADIKVGDMAELNHVITQSDIEKFVELTGDDNKLHIDKEYASKTIFKKPVAHGMLSASFISTIIGTKLPGDGALWFSQKLEFLLPVRVGDEITIHAEVIRKIDRDKVIELKTDIFNQHKQKVTTGEAKLKVIEKELSGEVIVEDNKSKKIALVIGGTGGIGRAACLALAGDGFDIIVHYNHSVNVARQIKEEVEKTGRKSMVVNADIVDELQIKEMMRKITREFETVTVLVNCTTIRVPNMKLMSLDWQDIQNHIDINIKGSFYLIRNIIPLMEKVKYGKVINIITQYTEGTPPSELIPYITAKAALSGFSRALAVELAPKGIRVNMVSPGMTNTELISDVPEKVRLITEAKTPLKKLAKPEDVANAICFLASDKSDYLTGETIRVNGGQVMI
ncbi:MAG: hypothetical protein A2W05_09700 [Candidatus Schekmanbacteria bacterium RBG_16_38_10]|uniref:MaoC-like domain-containing protein n=1 Tax=Candidatus Schekmanbacteria bacterium RBG_16_38_10 TaxID=1817879 RepID=A0A1F7RXH4_9BACT|nr:MAG: hypothetical protein A2W05_09700 [Candidatus Schekmanbacteria bacterium RBG_16_38_10]